jgi:hypothetical protein
MKLIASIPIKATPKFKLAGESAAPTRGSVGMRRLYWSCRIPVDKWGFRRVESEPATEFENFLNGDLGKFELLPPSIEKKPIENKYCKRSRQSPARIFMNFLKIKVPER